MPPALVFVGAVGDAVLDLVGVEIMPASWTSAPIEVAPAMSARATIWPLVLVSRPRTMLLCRLPTASLMLTARSTVKS